MEIIKKIKSSPFFIVTLIMIIFTYGILYSLRHFFPHFIYAPDWNIRFGWVIFALNTLIFIKGFFEYKKTSGKKMALVACGFFTAGLFEIMHFLHSFEGNVQFTYSYLTDFCYTFAGFSSLFYLNKPVEKNKKYFFANTLAFYLIFFSLATVVVETFITKTVADKLFALSGIDMIWVASYFLIALIYADIRKSNGLNTFSCFSLGYLFLFLNRLYVPNSLFFTESYWFLMNIENILGLIFIFIGLKDVEVVAEGFESKLKSYIPYYLYLIVIYILMLLLSSDAFNVSMPEYIQYYFLIFFIILMFAEESS